MSGTFSARIAELRHMIGIGNITGTVEVNQVYAHYQHERLDLHHPHGGGPLYLTRPLMDHFREYAQMYADSVLRDGGQRAVQDAMERLSDQVMITAPVLDGDLRRSGHPSTAQGGRTIHDRPPACARLTEAQLREKSRRRYPGLPDELKGWIWWHVQHHTKPPPRRR